MIRSVSLLLGVGLLAGCPDPRFVAVDADAASDAEVDADTIGDVAADPTTDDASDASSGGCTIEPSWLDRVQIVQAPDTAQPSGWFSRDLLLHGGDLFVGSPSEQAVYRYTVDEEGRWTLAQRIAAPRAAE